MDLSRFADNVAMFTLLTLLNDRIGGNTWGIILGDTNTVR